MRKHYGLNKVFAEFSHSARKVEELKECSNFAGIEYETVFNYYSRIRWLSLFQTLERLLHSWPAIKTYIFQQGNEYWNFISVHENDLHGDMLLPRNSLLTIPELHFYFLHHYIDIMSKSLQTVERNNTFVIE